jgi:hypothetical protein
MDRIPGSTFPMGSLNVTLYAQWSPLSHTLYFNANGGDEQIAIGNMQTDEKRKLLFCTFVKEGWSLDGWSECINGLVVYQDEDIFTMGYTDTILYAQWTIMGIGTRGLADGIIFNDDLAGYDFDDSGNIDEIKDMIENHRKLL